MFLPSSAEDAKWMNRPFGSKLLCERLGIKYEDYEDGSDADVNAFLDLLEEIPFEEKLAASGLVVLKVGKDTHTLRV